MTGPDDPTRPPRLLLSAEDLAGLVRAYFRQEKLVQQAGISNTKRRQRQARLVHLHRQLLEAVDFDQSWHPDLPDILRRKAEAKAAALAAMEAG